jgi:acyl-coenzyme A synthetase/AMP-(fatty) acid ligase
MNIELFDKLKEANHAGLVLFSSGTTGEPKIVLHDWNKLVEKALKRPNEKYHNWVVLNMLGLDHIGGINTVLFCLANQCKLVIPESRTPKHVCKAIEEKSVNILPTTPSFLRMLLISGTYKDYDLSSLRLITYGTEPMENSLLIKLSTAFPRVKLKQTYGLTEVGILSTQSESRESLLMKVGGKGFETRIVDGLLQIKSDTAMLGYLNYPSPFTEDGWLITGDKVVTNGDFMQIVGRESDFINVGGEKVNPVMVEEAVCSLPGIEDCAAYPISNELLGQVVGITVYAKDKNPDMKVITRMCKLLLRNKLPRHAIPMEVRISTKPLITFRFKKSRK